MPHFDKANNAWGGMVCFTAVRKLKTVSRSIQAQKCNKKTENCIISLINQASLSGFVF